MVRRWMNLLRRWPALYRLVERSYYALRPLRMKEYIWGTRAREREWATRHRSRGGRAHDDWGGGGRDWLRSYWDSRNHSHRPFLIEKISSFSPKSAFEIGCNCGPNLYLLAKKLPGAEIVGIDINREAIERGRAWLAEEGIANVTLLKGRADELERFPDKGFDIVFSDAVLIYIGPDKIRNVIGEMIRVARRALVLVEWNSFEPEKRDPEGLGVHYYGCWKRDYRALLRQFVDEDRIKITKITEEVWPDEMWRRVGAIVEVSLDEEGAIRAAG